MEIFKAGANEATKLWKQVEVVTFSEMFPTLLIAVTFLQETENTFGKPKNFLSLRHQFLSATIVSRLRVSSSVD